ncbi:MULTISPECIES: hypothetical protein [Stenotrophomonas]|uniref:hypothetical protein n=1 Tax=Stenotrophomonas TaxID=40323 RepID=UPI000871CA27|nr:MULTISPECIES: hypothetical protein [Stenotrophomonas]OEZ01435.1 hypothetical protein BIY45_06420 [Stenotrophomonas sp. BIIR7]
MKCTPLFAVLLLAAAAPAFAADTCESSFLKKGNPLKGTNFTASVSHPGLTVPSAIGQMRVIAKNANMDVIDEDVASGSMLIEEPQTGMHKNLPLIVSATNEGGTGTVGLLLKVNPGAFASTDGVKKAMCDLLTQVKPGKAGEQLAAATPKASVVNTTAREFGSRLRSQHKDNPGAMEARYQGKEYAITGRVITVFKDGNGYNTGFDVGGNPSGGIDFDSVAISCRFAPSQTAYAMALRPKENVTLKGVIDHYDQNNRVMWLRDCKGN